MTTRRRRVFLNVPYDGLAEVRVDAVEIGCFAARWTPVLAGDNDDGAERPEWQRVLRLMATCSLFVHDLSRDTGEGKRRIPRANNVLELGLALAATQDEASSRAAARRGRRAPTLGHGPSPAEHRRPRHLVLVNPSTPVPEMLADLLVAGRDEPERSGVLLCRDTGLALVHTVRRFLEPETPPPAAVEQAFAGYAEARARRLEAYERPHPTPAGLTWRFMLPVDERARCARDLLDQTP